MKQLEIYYCKEGYAVSDFECEELALRIKSEMAVDGECALALVVSTDNIFSSLRAMYLRGELGFSEDKFFWSEDAPPFVLGGTRITDINRCLVRVPPSAYFLNKTFSQ